MTINSIVNGLVQRGIGSPWLVGSGLIVVETRGRKSGTPRRVPVLAQRFGNTLFVSTVRATSQWVRNLEADATPSIVLAGKSVPVSTAVTRIGDWTLIKLELAT